MSPGNRQDVVARAIGDFMNGAGGEIYIPHAFITENGIITVRQGLHQAVEGDPTIAWKDNEATIRRLLNTVSVDPRWCASAGCGRHGRELNLECSTFASTATPTIIRLRCT